MALDDFKTDKEYGIGTVTTRKDISNITLPKEEFIRHMYYAPEVVKVLAPGLEENEIEALIEEMDKIIQEGSDVRPDFEDREEELRQIRNTVVEDYLKK